MSAETMRRLVELARVKEQHRQEQETVERHRNSHGTPHHNGHLSRGKSLAGDLSPRDPEDIVKKRMSMTDPNHGQPIRSFSMPRGKLMVEPNFEHGRVESTESAFSDYQDGSDAEIIQQLPQRAPNNQKRDSKTVSTSYSSDYTASRSSNIPAQQFYHQLRETRPGEYRKEMSVASHSSTLSHSDYSSTYHSNASTQDSRLPPPILDNISEASGYTTHSNYWGDSVPQSMRSDAPPFIPEPKHDRARVSVSVEPTTHDPETPPPGGEGGGGLFSCFPCLKKAPSEGGRQLQQLRSHTVLDDEPGGRDVMHSIEQQGTRPERQVSGLGPLPPVLDNLTATTNASRLRRPTAFSQKTIHVDDTMSANDVRMWTEPFGRGASGRVYKAIHLPSCTLIACKVTSSLSKDTIRQLLEECRAQTDRLPDIDQFLKILGWYRDTQTNDFVIALEYMDLGSVFDSCFSDSPAAAAEEIESQELPHEQDVNLSGHRQKYISKLNYDQIRHIARETLLALHVLHTKDRPLIHRDIKPQNILIASTGEVKLADFGLLYQLKSAEAICKDSKGTRKYFSPERIDCQFGVESDIWAFGVTMIEIFQQKLISPHLLNDFKIQQGLQAPEFLGATVPTEFVSFIGACLQKNPVKRPPAQILMTHPYIKGSWGVPAIPRGPTPLQNQGPRVNFLTVEPDHGMLDTFLKWLEEWILESEAENAKLFMEGEDHDLLQCLENISKSTGFGTLYIETLITEQYREFVNSV